MVPAIFLDLSMTGGTTRLRRRERPMMGNFQVLDNAWLLSTAAAPTTKDAPEPLKHGASLTDPDLSFPAGHQRARPL
jgi:hypothetical protein